MFVLVFTASGFITDAVTYECHITQFILLTFCPWHETIFHETLSRHKCPFLHDIHVRIF